MSQEKYGLGVINLFQTQTRREIIEYCFTNESVPLPDDENYDDYWLRKADLDDVTSVGREALRQNLGSLINLGILELRSEDARIPHYRVADTDVVELLQSVTEIVPTLCELFSYKARQRLVEFFLVHADPEQTYSMNKIREPIGMSPNTISDHIDILVEVDIATTVEGSRSTEYGVADSDMIIFLRTLNEVVVEYTEQ